MPERYQQGQLASPVVGTPGLDRSAGQAELQIAQTADAMRKDQNAMAMQGLQQAEQSFNSAYSAFHQWGAEKRYNARLAKAQENEQRRLQVQFDLQDESDRMNDVLGGLKEKYSADPQKAIQEYTNQVPVLRQQFMDRYQSDPIRLRMLMSAQRNAERGALGHLQSWAKETTTANLNRRLSLMPEQVTNKINGLSGSLQDQLAGFKETLTGTNAIYDNMRLSAVSQADHDNIWAKQIGLNGQAGKDFVNHVLAQVPDGEDGIKYLDTVGSVLKDPAKFGIPLDPEDHKSFVEHVHSERAAHEKVVVDNFKDDAALKVMDAKKLVAELWNAAENPQAMSAIRGQIQERLGDLNKQVSLVSKEPDSAIKNAKIMALKSEQSTYITEIGQEFKLQKQHQADMRNMLRFQQGQADRMMYLADRQERISRQALSLEEKRVKQEAENINLQKMVTFNNFWGSTQKDLHSTWGEPAGAARQEKIRSIVEKAIPVLDEALHTGAIDATGYKTHLNDLQSQVQTGAITTSKKPWFDQAIPGIGQVTLGGGTKTLTGKEKLKALETANAQFGSIASRKRTAFEHMNDAVQQLGVLSTSKAERTILTQQLNTKFPSVLSNAGYQKMTSQQQAAFRARFVKAIVTEYRQGK